ncbi:VCBS repeat-containing protein [Luteolibacter yonseiensis]|uniref:VCBS repeat-containing protein n=1 Tax=Luteolibacter yonseiensis TaxID=1144680 RepID=A0A934R614_9BACT|nr:VCBS repeat-containing protein [Luteolibacter yonseiensis]MBK1816628.1 VCBS repeat-containing protein [Luteolibacter yonseiensis]
MKTPTLFLLLGLPATALPEAKFRAVTIDAELQIGYGIAISDVDGDGKPDIVLADSAETVWYRNPDWKKSRITGKLTAKDNVCIAARDTDGDGKAEIAIGAEWNPGDTLDSGAVFSLQAPEDRSQLWKAAPQHREPTVHRMNWIREPGSHFLAVLPLHGCGNKNGEGDGIRFLGYRPEKDWKTFLIHEGFHMAHNFQPVFWNTADTAESLLVAEKEGVHLLSHGREKWSATRLTDRGSGEVQLGKNPDGSRFIATIEPMHGTDVAIYPEREKAFGTRIAVDSTLNQGHALVAADFLGIGSDQVAAGWREPGKDDKKVGIRLYAPSAPDGGKWQLHATISDNTMACEDMKSADLNGDGRPDLVASGRATRNLVIYWNETEKP